MYLRGFCSIVNSVRKRRYESTKPQLKELQCSTHQEATPATCFTNKTFVQMGANECEFLNVELNDLISNQDAVNGLASTFKSLWRDTQHQSTIFQVS